jgi:hypothetical protein
VILAGNLRSIQMSYKRLPLLALLMQLSGCSVFIAESGKDLRSVTTREQVQEEFGTPTESGEEIDGPFETYHTRRKISESLRGHCLDMGLTMTLGLGELFALPKELCVLARKTILGQDVKFHYDSSGRVSRIYLDGDKSVLQFAGVFESDERNLSKDSVGDK